MKLDKKDNIRLLTECCIVKEIEYTQKGFEEKAEEFKNLRKTIENSKDVSFESLKEIYPDNNTPTRKFLNQMQMYRKSLINRSYYKKAVQAAKEYYQTDDSINQEKFNSKIRNQFFNENRIRNLRVRINRDNLKFVGATTIATLLAVGALSLNTPNKEPVGPQVTPTPITTEDQTYTAEPTAESITSIDNLSVNDPQFYDKIDDNFKQLYADEYNKQFYDNQITPEDFSLEYSNQSYIFQIKLGEEYRYISHGNYPDITRKYLEDNNISYKTIEDISSASIYSCTEDGNHKKVLDRFDNATGSLVDEKLDSIAWVQNPYVDEHETICVRLYDGNNPGDLLNQDKSTDSPLTRLAAPVEAISTKVGTHKEVFKKLYIEAVEEYENSYTGINEAYDHEVEKQLIKEDDGEER